MVKERDSLSNEVKVIKEKTQPELLKELEDKFYDKSGLLDAKQLQKISENAGRDLETIIRRYTTIIKSAIQSGEPVPRIFVDFDQRDIEISLWEKNLQSY